MLKYCEIHEDYTGRKCKSPWSLFLVLSYLWQENLSEMRFFFPLLTCFSSLKLSFLCSFSPFLIFLFPVCFALGSACWATAPFHQDTLTFALRPRMLTTWQCHQSCGDSSVTQVSFLMPPVMSTLFTIMSPQSKAFLGWLVVSLLVS